MGRPKKASLQPTNRPSKAPKHFSFLDFCRRLGVKLTPGQEIIAAVAYDGYDPKDLRDPRYKELADRIFGDCQEIPKDPKGPRGVINITCGRASGKSSIFIATRLLWGALVRDLSKLAPGEEAQAVIVAPKLREAKHTLNFIKGRVGEHPELAAMVRRRNSEELLLHRPDGGMVLICARAASVGGDALRGKSFTDVAFEEAAFFRDAESGDINDEMLYQSASPRVMPGGQIIIASSPWTEAGLLFKFHKDNFGHPTTAVAVHAPTSLLRTDDEDILGQYEREKRRDPDNATREFDAQFLGGGTLQFFEATAVDASVGNYPFPRKAQPGEYVRIGADFGFKLDSSALVVVHSSPDGREHWIADILELRPERGKPLRPSAVVHDFVEVVRRHVGKEDYSYVMADHHYKESITEHLADNSLGFLDAPAGTHTTEPFVRSRMLFREGRVHIPDHPRLLAQLKAVQGRSTSGGGLKIHQPRLEHGGHGDIVSALVLALHQAGGIETIGDEPRPGTLEWAKLQEQRLLDRDLEQHEKKKSQQWWESLL